MKSGIVLLATCCCASSMAQGADGANRAARLAEIKSAAGSSPVAASQINKIPLTIKAHVATTAGFAKATGSQLLPFDRSTGNVAHKFNAGAAGAEVNRIPAQFGPDTSGFEGARFKSAFGGKSLPTARDFEPEIK